LAGHGLPDDWEVAAPSASPDQKQCSCKNQGLFGSALSRFPFEGYDLGMPSWLPIDDLEGAIVAALGETSRLILQAPTGSGKSTRLPQILRRHGLLERGEAVVLQPRRLAARLLAGFVARERGSALGGEVGYQIRFENVTSDQTRIRFVTEGILLRRMIADPRLAGVQALIFDEFHERHLYGDITLARALELQEETRPDLKIIVMSATLEVEGLEDYLRPCRALTSEGRVFPVEVEYLPHRVGASGPPAWELAAEAYRRRAERGVVGDALIFMPGSYEIQKTLAALRTEPATRGCVLLPLHGELAPGDQDAAVSRYDQPKIVVSTNVAETSVTIDGVRLVIDSGLARIPRYDPGRGINTLLIEKISQASAEQRAGRAGRTAPGHCIRLWSAREHEERPPREIPEVRRLDLSEVVLTLKAAGVRDLHRFRWLESPSIDGLSSAEILLTDLGALDRQGSITDLGRSMLAFPVHPRYARMLLAAAERGCVRQAALIAALTQGRDVLVRNPGREALQARAELFGDRADSDLWLLTRAWNYAMKQGFRADACRRLGVHGQGARQVGPLFEQFLDIARREGLDVEARQIPDSEIRKCVLAGFPDRLARRLDQGTLRCELVHGRRGQLERASVVQDATFLVAAEVHEVQGTDRSVTTRLSVATAVESAWISELFPGSIETVRDIHFDAATKRVQCIERQVFRELELASRRIDPPPREEAARLLAAEIEAGRLALPGWDHALEQWILRLNLLVRTCPELSLPHLGPAERSLLIQQVCDGAVSSKDLRDREVRPVVQDWLDRGQQRLVEEHAPERITLANGRTPKVVYDGENPPHCALRIQELFEVRSVPRIALGRVAVVVHILAPNMRPVQVTQDLEGFWREHYPALKQQLQRKYPKHEWR
jgi:ATP-dependent helicase HrpB